MGIPLMILAVGAVVAGLVGIPHALGGSNRIEAFLEPSFHPARVGATMFPGTQHEGAVADAGDHAAPAAAGHGEAATAEAGHGAAAAPAGHAPAASHADTSTELGLMALSVVVALAGISLATYFFKSNPHKADQVQQSFAGVHRVLLNKYYVDEFYDAVVVQPIKRTSERLLWKVVDAGVIDGAVNGTGFIVRTGGAILRLVQTGSVRVYAASVFVGVLVVIGYYLAR
jgi:NADH-quinone oxidoreductase subunit L